MHRRSAPSAAGNTSTGNNGGFSSPRVAQAPVPAEPQISETSTHAAASADAPMPETPAASSTSPGGGTKRALNNSPPLSADAARFQPASSLLTHTAQDGREPAHVPPTARVPAAEIATGTDQSTVELRDMIARLADAQVAAEQASAAAAQRAEAREKANADMMQQLLTKLSAAQDTQDTQAQAPRNSTKTRSSVALSTITESLKKQEELLESVVKTQLSADEMSSFSLDADPKVPIPVIAGQTLKKKALKIAVGNRLDPNLLTEEQERIDVAWRAWNIALHAELTSSTKKKAAGLTALLVSEYTTIEKDLDDLFVTLPALADDVRIAEQSAARRLLQEKWEARKIELLSKHKKARTKKALKKEQKAEADLASLLKRDKDSVRSAIDHTVDAKEAEMVTKYGLSVHDDTVGAIVPASDDIGAKLAAARARAADAQRMAATLDRESKTLTSQKKLSSEAKRKGKGKKPAAANASPQKGKKTNAAATASNPKNGNRRATPQGASGKNKGGAAKQGGAKGGRR
jgi:hypothetical protein